MQKLDLSSSRVQQKFSGICDKESKCPKDTFTEVLGNRDAEKLALAYFSYFQISRDFNTFMGNWDFRSFVKSFCPARLSNSMLWCHVQLWYQEVYDSGTSQTSPKHVPSTVSSEVHFCWNLFFFPKTWSKWGLYIEKSLNELFQLPPQFISYFWFQFYIDIWFCTCCIVNSLILWDAIDMVRHKLVDLNHRLSWFFILQKNLKFQFLLHWFEAEANFGQLILLSGGNLFPAILVGGCQHVVLEHPSCICLRYAWQIPQESPSPCSSSHPPCLLSPRSISGLLLHGDESEKEECHYLSLHHPDALP